MRLIVLATMAAATLALPLGPIDNFARAPPTLTTNGNIKRAGGWPYPGWPSQPPPLPAPQTSLRRKLPPHWPYPYPGETPGPWEPMPGRKPPKPTRPSSQHHDDHERKKPAGHKGSESHKNPAGQKGSTHLDPDSHGQSGAAAPPFPAPPASPAGSVPAEYSHIVKWLHNVEDPKPSTEDETSHDEDGEDGEDGGGSDRSAIEKWLENIEDPEPSTDGEGPHGENGEASDPDVQPEDSISQQPEGPSDTSSRPDNLDPAREGGPDQHPDWEDWTTETDSEAPPHPEEGGPPHHHPDSEEWTTETDPTSPSDDLPDFEDPTPEHDFTPPVAFPTKKASNETSQPVNSTLSSTSISGDSTRPTPLHLVF